MASSLSAFEVSPRAASSRVWRIESLSVSICRLNLSLVVMDAVCRKAQSYPGPGAPWPYLSPKAMKTVWRVGFSPRCRG
jgi:hypothetical protein